MVFKKDENGVYTNQSLIDEIKPQTTSYGDYKPTTKSNALMSQTSNGQALPRGLTSASANTPTTTNVLMPSYRTQATQSATGAETEAANTENQALIPQSTSGTMYSMGSKTVKNPVTPQTNILAPTAAPTMNPQTENIATQQGGGEFPLVTQEGYLQPIGYGFDTSQNKISTDAYRNSLAEMQGLAQAGQQAKGAAGGLGGLFSLLGTLGQYYAGKGLKNQAMSEINKMKEQKMKQEYQQGLVGTKEARVDEAATKNDLSLLHIMQKGYTDATGVVDTKKMLEDFPAYKRVLSGGQQPAGQGNILMPQAQTPVAGTPTTPASTPSRGAFVSAYMNANPKKFGGDANAAYNRLYGGGK